MIKPQLFFLHFAGGNSYSFNFIRPYISDFDVIQLELPGRGNRVDKELLTDFNKASEDLYQQILLKLKPSETFIYGHSMGAYLALKIVYMLAKVGVRVSYLIVSGNPGPGVNREIKRAKLGPVEFKEELSKIGGIPEEVLNNKDLMDFYEPILRADFQISEETDLSDFHTVKTPIYALMGDEEEGADEISNWANFTKLNFQFTILGGNHFFIRDHPAKIADILTQCKNYSLSKHQIL